MMRSITFDIVNVANVETLKDIITGKVSPKTRIVSIWHEQNAGLNVRGYVDQDRIVDVASECEQNDYQGIPVDLELKEGELFKAGFQEFAAGTPTVNLTVFYEETDS